MVKGPIVPAYRSRREMWTLRLSILTGALLISLFMIGDLKLVPAELTGLYFQNRAFVQLPMIFAVLALTFHRHFPRFAQPVFFAGIFGLTFSNYYLIDAAWERAGFSFPYEGTLLYAFFGFFVLGMRFYYSLWLMVLSTSGFLLLMLKAPVYGEYTFMNVGFVAGSLFIGVIARYRLSRNMHKRRYANDKLLELSNVDALTDLLNRRAFKEESEKLFELSRRSNQPFAVFMMDLDHFKAFNDRHGHQAGDHAIKTHAEIMEQIFQRKTDVLGRYGGEEFIAVTMSQRREHACRQGSRIVDEWKELAIRSGSGEDDDLLSCSVGICHGLAADYESIDEMIRIADRALYCAKERGRARVVVSKRGQPEEQWTAD